MKHVPTQNEIILGGAIGGLTSSVLMAVTHYGVKSENLEAFECYCIGSVSCLFTSMTASIVVERKATTALLSMGLWLVTTPFAALIAKSKTWERFAGLGQE